MDTTSLLVAAIAAIWAVVYALARELRSLWMRALNDRDQTIAELKSDARATFAAKEEELREWRKRALDQAENRQPPRGQTP